MGLFGDIFKDIGNILNLTNVFGGKSDRLYPQTIGAGVSINTVTNHIENYKNKDWRSNRGYAFNVYRVSSGGGGGAEAAVQADGWSEFRLQINPQELTQDEIFAIEVTPTLRGILVEHHGVIMKDITISGTTGISPLRREGGANVKDGSPILQSGHSGFYEFQELRSYFRAYVEAKRLDQREGGELRMVFKNFKDQEYLYVEPQKFSMKRQASRPMLYDYQIALKAIGYFANTQPSGPTGFLASLDAILETVTDTLTTVNQVLTGSIGIIARTERKVASAIIGPLNQINQAALAIRGGQATLLGANSITRSFIDGVKASVENIEANLNAVFGSNMTAFNKLAGRTSTLTATAGRQKTFQELQVLNALGKAKQALILLSSQKQLFDQNVFDSNAGVVSIYGSKVNLKSPNSVKQSDILGDDNIHTIAVRELGDADRFRDIVILNNLKPPYIDPAGGPGVLKPGQKILIPKQATSVPTGVSQNKQYNITALLSEVERAMGVDIRLTGDADMAINNTGDLDLIAGMDNMVQVCAVKLFLEIGGLKRHPTIGTRLQLGGKVTSQFLSELQGEIINSFTKDPRVESIPFIQLNQNGGTTTINMLLKLVNIAQPVPLPITLNVG